MCLVIEGLTEKVFQIGFTDHIANIVKKFCILPMILASISMLSNFFDEKTIFD